MKGQTIIEVMVALAVGLVVLSAVTIAVLTSLNNVEQTSSQGQAGNLSLEGLELMRKMRDNDLETFNTLSGNYCMAEACSSLTNSPGVECGKRIQPCTPNAGRFVREVSIEKNSLSCRLTPAPSDLSLNGTQVSVTVSWQDKSCNNEDDPYCNDSTVDSCLFPTIPE